MPSKRSVSASNMRLAMLSQRQRHQTGSAPMIPPPRGAGPTSVSSSRDFFGLLSPVLATFIGAGLVGAGLVRLALVLGVRGGGRRGTVDGDRVDDRHHAPYRGRGHLEVGSAGVVGDRAGEGDDAFGHADLRLR